MNPEIADLALEDLGAADERLYVAALRFCRTFERAEINCDGSDGMTVGEAVRLLAEAVKRRTDACQSCEDSGLFGSEDQESEAA